MRRIGGVLLALLTGILFPILIWVALGAALREPLQRALWRGVSTFCALSRSLIVPVLQRVGIGDTVREFLLRWEKRLQRRTSRSISELLAGAGLAIRMEASNGQPAGALYFQRRPIEEIHELLARAGCESRV